jgi:hypothetical protein
LLVALCGCDAFDTALLDPPLPQGGVGGGGGSAGGVPAMDSAVHEGGMNAGGTGGFGGLDSGAFDSGGTESGLPESGVIDSGMDATSAVDASEDASEDATMPEAAVDHCPSDPNKLEPGACGCGGDEALAATCSALSSALRHRYSFDGTGTHAIDSVSAANGVVMNAALDDSGTLTLAGGTSNEHVALPAGIISALTNATFEIWLRWDGTAAWERIFDFGTASGASGTSYIFLTPRATNASGRLRAAMSLSGASNETQAEAASALGAGALHHVAVVVDDDGDQLHLYVDGALQDSAALTTSLSSIDDATNWLGRSHFSTDPELTGTYHEVRIYTAALSAAQLSTSFQLGPDPPFLP